MKYVDLPNTKDATNVAPDSLRIEKSRELINCILKHSFCKYVECKILDDGDEIIIFETEPEVSQSPIIDIRYKERIAIFIGKNDSFLPFVFALREDFPLVTHLNAMNFEKPRSLCLYEVPYDDLKVDWSAILFIERIREWLSLTATGSLHQSDQPLEPFLNNLEGTLILPEKIKDGDSFNVLVTNRFNDKITLIATKKNIVESNPDTQKYKVFCFMTPEYQHGIIKTSPRSLLDLHFLLKDLGVDFIEGILKPELNQYIGQKEYHNYNPIFLIIVPKKRNRSSDEIVFERIAFVSLNNIKEISLAVNLWFEAERLLAHLIPKQVFDKEKIENFKIGALATNTYFSKKGASIYNNIESQKTNCKIALIGAGALGSQVFLNLTRMGFGNWTILDNDVLLPHNLARHALTSAAIGHAKAEALSYVANEIVNDPTHSKSLQDNYLHQKNPALIGSELSKADFILDISASVPVARKLAFDKFQGRRVSLFLNPTGTDLVMLAESTSRETTLDCIEMQYYKFLIRETKLNNHLQSDIPIRYGNSCRDISGRMRQDNISILAGVGSKAVIGIKDEDATEIKIWKSNDNGGIEVFNQEVFGIKKSTSEFWNVIIDDQVLNELFEQRRLKLPSETGGILLGTYDTSRRIIYIVDSIPSPSDSKEYPTAYYRGIEGVSEIMENVSNITAGNVSYLGEWHSHPKKASLNRSSDDNHLFEWLKEHMDPIGRPPLMLIVGDDNNFKIYTE